MLHIINQSSLRSKALHDCLQVVDDNSVILFIEDGVYNALEVVNAEAFSNIPEGATVYVLRPDLIARGIDIGDCSPSIKTIDYQGFVQLVVENNPVRSWF